MSTETPEQSLIWQRKHMAEAVEHVRFAADSLLASIREAEYAYEEWIALHSHNPLREFDEAQLAARVQSAAVVFMFNAQLDRLSTAAAFV